LFFWNKTKSDKIIYAYNDAVFRGKSVVKAAKKLGIRARLFRKAKDVPNDKNIVAFMRMMNVPDFREKNKRIAEELSKKNKILMIPRIHEARLYDDKIAQTKLFSACMPKTYYLTSKSQAEEILDIIGFPFVSKASEGSSSKNVRFVKDKKAANNEILTVFSGKGIDLQYSKNQKGYLLWQEFLPDNLFDWRVVVLAKKYVCVVKRYNKEGLHFASGSDKVEAIKEISDEILQLLNFSIEFVNKFDLSMTALDIISNQKGDFVVLETSCAWVRKVLPNSIFKFHDGKWTKTEHKTSKFPDLIVKAIIEGDFI